MSAEEPYSGWTIVELLGHRRLAGMVTEATIAGAGFLRIDMPSACSGIGASYCEVHGDCVCPRSASTRPDGEQDNDRPSLDDPKCPLHAPDDETHGREWWGTQFASPASVYALTPCTEEAARRVSAQLEPRTPRPIRSELAALVASFVPDDDDGDFE